jgi:hypothetical protein
MEAQYVDTLAFDTHLRYLANHERTLTLRTADAHYELSTGKLKRCG